MIMDSDVVASKDYALISSNFIHGALMMEELKYTAALYYYCRHMTTCRYGDIETSVNEDRKKTPWPLVSKRTIPTLRPPLVEEI
jgi:hypothetical protein